MSQMHHYMGCGLPNVYLQGGFEVVSTPYGEGVSIQDIDGLHAAIGQVVVCNPAALTGAEFRFLRQELELSQAALGDLLGRDEQTVARWEKGKSKKVDPAADRLLRLLYRESKFGSKKLEPQLEFLRKLESRPHAPKSILASGNRRGWKAEPASLTA